MCGENWKPVVGFEDRYEVSDLGRVKSLNYRGSTMKIRIMKATPNYAGYLVITLGKDHKQYRVGRLVLESFVGPCPENQECCHDDGDRGNNKLNNLRWGTSIDNGNDKRRHGVAKGMRNSNSKLTENDVIDIRNSPVGFLELAKKYGITHQQIRNIVLRKRGGWDHLEEKENV